MTRLAFDVYDPPTDPSLGTRRARLTGAELGPGSFYRHTLGGIGTGRIVVERGQSFVTAAIMRTGNYIVVRDLDLSATDTLNVIGGWTLQTGDFAVVEDPGRGVLEFGGPSTKALLADAIMGPESLSPFEGPYSIVDGYWRWGSDVYGGVLRRAILEANLQDPPGLPMIDIGVSGGVIVGDGLNWDDSGDSNGDPWPSFAGEFRTQAGSDLLSLATELYGYGVETDIDARTFDMYAYNAGGFGSDLTGGAFGAGVVRFVGGVNIGRRLERHIQGRLPLTHVLVRTVDHPEGAWIESDSYTPGDPVRKGVYQTGDISGDPASSAALQARVQRMIDIRGLAEDGIEFHTIKPGDDEANGRYTPGPHYSPGATATAGHFWVGDYVTVHSGVADVDYNNATKRVESITYEMAEAADDDDGGWNVIVGIGPRVGAGTTAGTPSLSAIPLPFQLCQPSTPGEVLTGRIYYTGNGGDVLTNEDYSSSWDAAGDVDGPKALEAAPANTFSYGGSGTADLADVNLAADRIVTGIFVSAFELGDIPGLLGAVQSGALWQTVIRSRNRFGIGISEDSQENYPTGALRIYRPGTASFVGTVLDVGEWEAAYIFYAGSARPSIPMEGTGAAVPGAASTDRLVVDLGANHVGPTSGGTGWAYHFADSYADDLPYIVDSQADQNSWLQFSYTGSSSGSGDGNADLIGNDPRAKRCDDTEHYHSDREPTPADDVSQGMRIGTLWLDENTGRVWWLTDNAEGAAVWILISDPTPTASGTTLTIEETDGSPSGVFDTLKVPAGSLTDNGDGSATLEFVADEHAHDPPTSGAHVVIVKRTTNFSSSNTNESIPDYDTILVDTMAAPFWDAGEPDRFVVPAEYDGLTAIWQVHAAVADPGGNDYLELKLYRFEAAYGEPRPLADVSAEEDRLLTVEQQPATNDVNHFIHATTDPFTLAEGDILLAAHRSPGAMTYIPYNGRVSLTMALWILGSGGAVDEESPGVSSIWRPVMAYDPGDDHWYVVVDGDGTAVMAEG